MGFHKSGELQLVSQLAVGQKLFIIQNGADEKDGVDIVETGSTLRENGLQVLEEVCPLSARVVVNPVSMRMENERITQLLKEIKAVL